MQVVLALRVCEEFSRTGADVSQPIARRLCRQGAGIFWVADCRPAAKNPLSRGVPTQIRGIVQREMA
jgi:hypothetical protein